MANLTAVFELVDRMSDKLDSIADSGMKAVDQWEAAESSADSAFSTAENGGRRAAQSVDGVADSARDMSDATDEAARSVENFGESAEHAGDDADKFGEKSINAFQTLSNTLVATAVAKGIKEVADALVDASDAAASAETAYAKLQTIAGADAIGGLTDEIRDLSAETGQSVESLADLAYNAISAGASVDNAVSTAAAATKLAAAGFTESGSALSVLTTAMNAYGDAAGPVEDISNSLIMVQNLGVTTVGELASNMGRAISTAAAFNVSLGNLESGYVSMTKAGINTAESTTYLSAMFAELGKDGSEVSNILVEQTGKSFGALMNDGYSLADVLEILYENVGRNSEALMNLWGSQTAGKAASAIVNQGLDTFNQNLIAIENSAGATESAYSTMVETTAHANERMQNSMANLSIAVGDAVNPAFDKMYSLIADVTDGITHFAQAHPTAIKVVTALGVGVAAVAIGIAGVTFVTTVAIPAITAFGVALNTALGPIGWVALAIGGIVAAGTAFIAMMDNYEDETLEMTSSTRAQYYELQDLNAEYERACEEFGETSEEALRLKYQVDDLSASFNSNRQTIEEFANECQAVIDAHADMVASFDESRAAVDSDSNATLALAQKLSDLADGTYTSAEAQGAMQAIINQLNSSIDGLNVTYSDLILNQSDTIDNIRAMAQAQAEQQRQQEQYEEYVKLLSQRADEEAQLAKAVDEVTASQERSNEANKEYNDLLTSMTRYDTTGFAALGAMFTPQAKAAEAAEKALNTATEAQDGLQAALDDTNARIKEIEESWGLTEDAINNTADATVSYEDAVSVSLSMVQEDIDALCAAYDAAYESARSSIDGQIGLFDTMTTETKLSIDDMTSAFQSQIDYLNTYSENLRKAAEYGLDEGLIASLSDGSEESAGYLNAIIENIEALGESSEEAQAFVDDFNASFQEVEAAKDEFASTVATMETDFDEKMAEIEGRLDEAIDSMNMEADAAAAAKDTIDAYTQAIKDGTSNAVAAAEAAASAVAAALNTSYTGGTTVTVAGHASGTTNAEDVFVAGEDGPELILGAGGSTVFPADETQKIINAIGNTRDSTTDYYLPPVSYTNDSEATSGPNGDGVKKVLLEIAGKGNIELTGGNVDDDTLLEFLYQHLKPVLSEIISQEIFEEGDSSYEY